jgi:queuine tRNA-ribosyltransferase
MRGMEHMGIFRETHRDGGSAARAGRLDLPHGSVTTPAFMPVGTAGSVKAVTPEQVAGMGFRLILGNTYHLYLRPGLEVIDAFGSLHAFSGWPHNILTDSGGYQVFSLAPFRKIREEGVDFQSHIDGSRHRLTPEAVVGIQARLGSDIQMALDVCTGYGADRAEAEEAVALTTAWARRAYTARRELSGAYAGALFGIVQGNFFKDLRRRSLEEICAIDFPGFAVGGLSVGEPFSVFEEFVAWAGESLPADKPRYVMGIGTPEYIFTAVRNGFDMFDCVFPTRTARNGTVFTRDGRVVLRNADHRYNTGPIEEGCSCYACRNFSRAYLRHLFKAGEMLGPMLTTQHNLHFLSTLMRDVGAAIRGETFARFEKSFLERYNSRG